MPHIVPHLAKEHPASEGLAHCQGSYPLCHWKISSTLAQFAHFNQSNFPSFLQHLVYSLTRTWCQVDILRHSTFGLQQRTGHLQWQDNQYWAVLAMLLVFRKPRIPVPKWHHESLSGENITVSPGEVARASESLALTKNHLVQMRLRLTTCAPEGLPSLHTRPPSSMPFLHLDTHLSYTAR